MNIDLLHNKIIKDTVSEQFVSAVLEYLVPALEEKYGDALLAIQMYEDYISDGFTVDGFFYYPLTLVFDGGARREWIKWDVSNKSSFSHSPYSYVGTEPLEFSFVDSLPSQLEEKLSGRAMYFEGGYIPLNVQSVSSDKTFLAGKYSQTFIDELNRQISDEIQRACYIEGAESSTLSMLMVFAPETYMEHVVENVTYRRLLISAKGCSARDLWIKWTRLDSALPFTVSDTVSADTVRFELGEDVPQKIREKEYRFLVRSSVEKYQYAMGRKNVTEWRDLIKRVIKRGEVIKLELPIIDSPENDELNEKLLEALGGYVDTDCTSPEENENADIEQLLRATLEAAGDTVSYEPEEDELIDEELRDDEDAQALDELAALDSDEPVDEQEEELEEPEEEAFEELDDEPEESIDEYEDYAEQEQTSAPELSIEELMRAREEEIRREIEARVRAEYEEKIRQAEQARLAEKAAKDAEEERLRREIEAKELAERRERERLAEAAREALVEAQRLEREREERLAEQRRLAEEQRNAEAEAKRAEERRLEEERIRAEMLARQKEEEKASAPRVTSSAPHYTYTSKSVKLIFRAPVDPNVTKRIQEIIVTTVKYYHKENVYMKIKATVPDINTVVLDFVKIPEEETKLIVDIIQVLGKSNLGITKATLE